MISPNSSFSLPSPPAQPQQQQPLVVTTTTTTKSDQQVAFNQNNETTMDPARLVSFGAHIATQQLEHGLVADLRELNNDLTVLLLNKEVALQDARQRCTDLEAERGHLAAENNVNKAKLGHLDSLMRRLESELNNKIVSVISLSDTNDASVAAGGWDDLNNDIAVPDDLLSAANEKIQLLEAELAQVRSQNETSLNSTRCELAASRDNFARLEQEIGAMNALISKRDSELAKLVAQLEAKNGEYDALLQHYYYYKGQVDEFVVREQQFNEQLTQKGVEFESLQREYHELVSSRKTEEETAAAVDEDELAQLNEVIQIKEAYLNQRTEEVAMLEGRLNEVQARSDQLAVEIEEKTSELAEARKAHEEAAEAAKKR
jgi:chromosome segregation ATPase